MGSLLTGFPVVRFRAFRPCGFPAYILTVWAHDKESLPADTPCASSTIPRDGFLLLMGMYSFHHPEGSLLSHTIRAFSSTFPKVRFRHALHTLLPCPRRDVSVTHSHTLLSPPRRVASVTHAAIAFLDSEESVPTNTLAYSIHSSEEPLPSYAPYTSSAFPKDRFRRAHLTLPPLPRRAVSVALGLSSLLKILRRVSSVCRKESLLYPLRGPPVSRRWAEA